MATATFTGDDGGHADRRARAASGRIAADARRSFWLAAGRGELSPKRVHVAAVTAGDRFRERASVEDRVHHAGKARPVEIAKVGDEHSGLPVGEHRAM